ncbi:MAG: hypothetical protein Q7S87_16105 [Agitococcus sp.]|nr:hypothetical protein [Agitococcus sp.]MDO9179072.1 hypothetical protein [Agitococcus sp.]
MKKIHLLVLSSVLLSSSLAFAETALAPCEGLQVATGPKGKGYSKLFADLKKVCGAEVPLCEVPTSGGLDNLNSMATKDAQVGFVQLDTFNGMKSGNENVSGLQAVAGLNFNYLHVIARAKGYKVQGEKKWGGMMAGDVSTVTITRFSDLANKRVALVGSAQLLGRELDKQMRFHLQVVDVESDAKAFDMVRNGTVAAALSVSGWPSDNISALKQDSGLTLIPYDAPIQAPYVVRPLSYKDLGVYNNNALAVPNLLLSRPFKGQAATMVAALKTCMSERLNDLQEGKYAPGWNEIKDLNNTFDVPRFVSAASAKAGSTVKSTKR